VTGYRVETVLESFITDRYFIIYYVILEKQSSPTHDQYEEYVLQCPFPDLSLGVCVTLKFHQNNISTKIWF
jgi:hypothetical protein